VEHEQAPVRPEPRISINSLAEYLTAPPVRRGAIVKAHKRPRPVVVAHYAQAQKPIVEFLAAGGGSGAYLLRAAERLEAMAAQSGRPARTRMLLDSAAALQRFAGALDVFTLPGPVSAVMPGPTPYLNLSGVRVSVRPELLYTVPSRNQAGLVKLYFSKTRPLSPEEAWYTTAALYRWGADVAGLGESLVPQRCLVLDVFAGRTFAGARAFTRRLAELEAACEEIALRWPGA
jgi:hypothetical protein